MIVVRRLYLLLAVACWFALLSGATVPRGMRTLTTPHYAIHTDLPAEIAADMAGELEFVRGEFERRLGVFDATAHAGPGPRRGRFEVYLFSRQADYEQFTEGRFPNTGGVFVGGRNAVAVYHEGQGRGQMRKTLRHEAFHQFAQARLGRLPTWANEGLAQLFEEGLRVGPSLRLGLVPPDRVRQLRHDAAQGRLAEFDELLSYDESDWTRALHDRGRSATRYTQAWATIHFLLYATDSQGRPIYRERFNRLLDETARGGDGPAIFAAEFAGLGGEFGRYVAGLTPTGEATILEHQRVLAELLILLRDRGEVFASVEDFRRHADSRGYRLECRRDEVTWRTDADVGVYFGGVLRFIDDPAGAMPALERRTADGLVFRTGFHQSSGRVTHETLCGVE